MSNNWMFVGAAFAITWAVLIGYLIRIRDAERRARESLALANAASGGTT